MTTETTPTIRLRYHTLVTGGYRVTRDALRDWPVGSTLGDVMKTLLEELQGFGCTDTMITLSPRNKTPVALEDHI